MPTEKRSQINPVASHGNGDVHQSDVAGIQLAHPGFAASALRRLVALGTGLLFMRTEPVDQIAKMRARGQ